MAKKEILNNDVATIRVGETAADILQEAQEVTEKTLDILENTAERVVTVTKNNPFVLAGVLIAGAGIGAFVAYKVAHKRLSEKFEAELTEQIAAAKAYRMAIAKEGVFETPESAVQALVPEDVVEAVSKYQGKKVPYNNPKDIVVSDPRPDVNVVVEEVVVNNNVFTQARDNDPRDWDFRLEVADREANPDTPYVIHFDEFEENPEGNDQQTLAYYEGDETLCDEKDQMIDNVNYTIGEDNLGRFGHGSHDPNVVYVRNEKLGVDFEINRSPGTYQAEVLGIENPESVLRHSHRRPNRRPWRDDEPK